MRSGPRPRRLDGWLSPSGTRRAEPEHSAAPDTLARGATDTLEDLRKAKWYIEREIGRLSS